MFFMNFPDLIMYMLLIKKVIQLALHKSYESERVKAANDDLLYKSKKKLILSFGRLYKQS